jgi:hypothetical protein
MKFFVPASNESNVNQVYSALKLFAEKELSKPVSIKKIFALNYDYHNKPVRVEVGATFPSSGETILAIFESEPFAIYVIDPQRKSRLVLVGADNIQRIEEFES